MPYANWVLTNWPDNTGPKLTDNFFSAQIIGPTAAEISARLPRQTNKLAFQSKFSDDAPKKIRRQGCFARTTFFVRLHFFRAHGMYNVATSPSFKVNNRIIKFLPTHSGLRQGYPGDGACSGIFGTKKCKRPAYVTARKKFIYGSNANKQLRNRGSFANGSFFERC